MFRLKHCVPSTGSFIRFSSLWWWVSHHTSIKGTIDSLSSCCINSIKYTRALRKRLACITLSSLETFRLKRRGRKSNQYLRPLRLLAAKPAAFAHQQDVWSHLLDDGHISIYLVDLAYFVNRKSWWQMLFGPWLPLRYGRFTYIQSGLSSRDVDMDKLRIGRIWKLIDAVRIAAPPPQVEDRTKLTHWNKPFTLQFILQ